MQVAVDISLYPLDEDFIPPIKNVIERLGRHDGVAVEYNRMSTQLRGEYDVVIEGDGDMSYVNDLITTVSQTD